MRQIADLGVYLQSAGAGPQSSKGDLNQDAENAFLVKIDFPI
jgi:hypothetical protein